MPSSRRHGRPSDPIEELDSLAERLAEWVGAHRALSIGLLLGIVLAAAAAGGYLSWSQHRADRASAALAKLETEFVVAMGGQPTDLEPPEPANPETGQRLRREYAQRLLAFARRYTGTAAAARALLEAGELEQQAGEPEKAIETWRQGLAAVHGHDPLRGLLLSRIAQAEEAAGRYAEAARAHEQAAQLDDYPLRVLALADAMRCWVEAGDRARARAAAERLRQEKGDLRLPAHLETLVRELVTAGAGAGDEGAPRS